MCVMCAQCGSCSNGLKEWTKRATARGKMPTHTRTHTHATWDFFFFAILEQKSEETYTHRPLRCTQRLEMAHFTMIVMGRTMHIAVFVRTAETMRSTYRMMQPTECSTPLMRRLKIHSILEWDRSMADPILGLIENKRKTVLRNNKEPNTKIVAIVQLIQSNEKSILQCTHTHTQRTVYRALHTQQLSEADSEWVNTRTAWKQSRILVKFILWWVFGHLVISFVFRYICIGHVCPCIMRTI